MAKMDQIIQHIRAHMILIKYWIIGLIELFTGGPPLKDVSSEIILITGAASGLGKGLAERFSRLGCTLVLWDVDEVNNDRLAQQLNEATNSKRIHAMKCDLTKKENIYECARKVKDTVGNVTMVINNAGVVSGRHLLDCSDASIQRTFDVNVIAHFWVLKAFLPWMLENNRGHIVTIASGAGIVGVPSLVDYCSSKFAAVGLHDALTHELFAMGKGGVKTTVVCPSFINTGMFDGIKATEISPLLNTDSVCDSIVGAIRKNQYMLLLPKSLNILVALNSVTPMAATLEIQQMSGIHQSMDTFVGRHQKSA